MALSQQKFREMVFQILYSQDMGAFNEILMTSLMMDELEISKKNVRLAQERVGHIWFHLKEIDSLIASVSTSYSFDRIQTVTKNILRLSVFEIFFDDHIPAKVAIAEAIRLSRKFNTPESASFVNAILDHLYQASLGHEGNLNLLTQQSQVLMQREKMDEKIAQEQKLKDDQP